MVAVKIEFYMLQYLIFDDNINITILNDRSPNLEFYISIRNDRSPDRFMFTPGMIALLGASYLHGE